MLKALKNICVILFVSLAHSILLLTLMRYIGYDFRLVNVVLLALVAMSVCFAARICVKWEISVLFVRLAMIVIGFLLCCVYALIVNYDTNGNMLMKEMISVACWIHLAMLPVVMLDRKK